MGIHSILAPNDILSEWCCVYSFYALSNQLLDESLIAVTNLKRHKFPKVSLRIRPQALYGIKLARIRCVKDKLNPTTSGRILDSLGVVYTQVIYNQKAGHTLRVNSDFV